ncbi:MAG: hypothetical protein D4R56_04940 [Deltaproteobacteria bacterium]|nr:MAG: hypothetical protein D4R56_04940 [Deltaproteobacteria bacterium]
MFKLFDNINPIHFLYLLYGASFLFLGVSIAAKDMKESKLKLGESLWLLSSFGFLHGAHEWLDLGTWVEGKNLSYQQIFTAEAVSVGLLILSFIFLMYFGLSLIKVVHKKWIWRYKTIITACLFLTWLLFLLQTDLLPISMQFLKRADIGARYTFGFIGSLLTSYGLIAYSREIRPMSLSVSRRLNYAGVTFLFYAFFSGVFSSRYTMPLVPAPIELLRGGAAIIITYFICQALNIFDIETRRKIEQQARLLVQAEKLSSLGRLAAGIAHEINNPLTNASLGVQTLKHKLGSEGTSNDVVERLSAIEKNIDRASLIAQELLQFSHPKESGFQPVNINDAIKSSLNLMQYKLNNIDVVQRLASVPHVMGDPVKLEQVFINILSNSVEAMPEGGKISIASLQNVDTIEVRITDTGCGISEENQSRVFEPFFTTKDIGSGTGLGLSMSYGIISQHHGFIELTSKPEEGTAVTIKIPTKERYEKDTYRG